VPGTRHGPSPGRAVVTSELLEPSGAPALAALVDRLRLALQQGRTVEVELQVASARLHAPEVVHAPLWRLGDGHRLLREELAHLVTAHAHAHARTHARHRRAGRRWPAAGEELSSDQRAAVEHDGGAARVIAPAGSGKTRVLAARLRHLVLDRSVPAGSVTALAYNTRAAAELTERTADVHVAGVRPHVRTVHALCLAICTAAADATPRILTEHEATRLVAHLLGRARVAPAYLDALGEVRLALSDPHEVEARRGDVPGLEALVPRYRRWLAAHGCLDFDEQVHRAVELLLTDPSLRERVRRTCVHLLVDEAQDLTPAFVLLVRLLAGPAQQVFAVGDDDQTIYGYAGASPRVLVDFTRWFPGAASYALEVNHRCPPAVVVAARTLLTHNTLRVPKTIRPAARAGIDAASTDGTEGGPDGGQGTGLELVEVEGGGTQAVVARVLDGLARGAEEEDVAVLARVGATLLAVQIALGEAGITHRAIVGPEVLARTGLRTVLAYLRCAVAPERIDARDLDDTLRRPYRRLSGVVTAGSSGVTSLSRLARLLPRVDAEHRGALHHYLGDLEQLGQLARDGADTSAIIVHVRDRIGLGPVLDAVDRTSRRPEGSSHADDLDALLDLAHLEPDPAAFPGWLAARLHAMPDGGADAASAAGAVDDDHGAQGDGVTLSTVHRVKGREWDEVILVGLRAGLMPHRLAEDVEEERRVLHVALTRARQRLTLVVDPDRPSVFLPELLGTIRPAHAGAHAAAHGADAEARIEAELIARLKAWRRSVAAGLGVPAFLVAHDRTLAEIARRRPQDRTALLTCAGIGPVKAERFGADLLRLVAS
jgi:DNA helicase-2/ATP-dependent DNA helicase PcrA